MTLLRFKTASTLRQMSRNSSITLPPTTFGIVGAVFLLAAVVAALHSVALGLPSLLHWTVGEAATACAGFGTVAAICFALFQFTQERSFQRSRFALDMAMDGIERSYAVLTSTDPATNVSWVNGARLLLHAEALARSISEDEHKAAWNLFKEEWRIKFYDLTLLPAEYFFGLPVLAALPMNADYGDERLREMMERSAYEPTIVMTGRLGTGSRDRMLSVRALKVIFDFAQFPEDYRASDPLQAAADFTQADRDRMDISSVWGLFAYLYARDRWSVAFGKLTENNPSRDGDGAAKKPGTQNG